MKNIKYIGLIIMCLLLFGCGNDMSKYDKVALTSENLENYIDCEQTSSSYSEKIANLKYEFYSKNDSYVFEDVMFDTEIQESYYYTFYGISGMSTVFYVNQRRVKLDEKGNGGFNINQTVEYKIDDIKPSKKVNYFKDTPEVAYSNVKGYIYIPWEE